jgi:hypothetical protein
VTSVSNYAWVWNGSAYIVYDRLTIPGVIGAEQGFFVQTTAGGGSVTLPDSAGVHNTVFYKDEISNLLTLRTDGNNHWDQTHLLLNSNASAGYEAEYDALKLMGSINAPQIYSILPDTPLSINTIPDVHTTPVIPIGFKAGTENTFTITASGISSFEANTEFYLEDLLSGKVQNLKVNPVYNFSASSGQDEHRFNLHFTNVGARENKPASGVKIYSADQTIYVNITTSMNGTIIVYNMLGSEISRKNIEPLSLNKINLDVPTGFYLVKVEGDAVTSTSKVFIR